MIVIFICIMAAGCAVFIVGISAERDGLQLLGLLTLAAGTGFGAAVVMTDLDLPNPPAHVTPSPHPTPCRTGGARC